MINPIVCIEIKPGNIIVIEKIKNPIAKRSIAMPFNTNGKNEKRMAPMKNAAAIQNEANEIIKRIIANMHHLPR